MQSTAHPTLLEIATIFEFWQEYADPAGIDSEEQFYARSDSENLQLLQECGFSETLLGDLYSDDGFIAARSIQVEIMQASASRLEKPTIRIGTHVCLTEDCGITANKITGPGGWYVIIRGTEGGEE